MSGQNLAGQLLAEEAARRATDQQARCGRRRQQRAELDAVRQYGLRARQRARLARLGEGGHRCDLAPVQ